MTRTMKRITALAAAALLGAAALWAQDGNGGIPREVFYLMPELTQGSVRFVGKAPATGKFNICAIDNTIRYKDRSGTELAVELDDEIAGVTLGDVTFIPVDGAFYRLYPITGDVSVAVRRDVLLMTDSKTASYGMDSQTTAVSTMMGMNEGGKVFNFEDMQAVPYRMSETAFLYRNDAVLTLSKRSFTKCFPAAKADIDAWFAANKKMDGADIAGVLALACEWAAK